MKDMNQTPQQINVDLSAAKDVSCDACGNMTFQEVYLLKYLSEIQSPTGKAGVVPFPIMGCNACGHVNFDMLPKFMKDKQQQVKQSKIELV